MITRQLILFFLFVFSDLALQAQISFNGNFEQLDFSGSPRLWSISDYQGATIDVDSVESFQGKYALRVVLENKHNSAVVYQVIRLAPGSFFQSAKLSYHVKFMEGDTGQFRHFFRPQSCTGHNGAMKTQKVIWNMQQTWKELSVYIEAGDTACNEIYLGFLVDHKAKILVDSITLEIDSKKMNDVPLPELKYYNTETKKYINANSIPLRHTGSNLGINELSFFKNIIDNAPLVALGEGTHGSREFVTLRNRLMLYMIDSLQYDIVSFENSFAATRQLTDLLKDSSFTVRRLVDSFFYRIYQTEEMVELLSQIRERNKKGRNIRIEGFDTQDGYYTQLLLLNLFKNFDTVLYEQLLDMERYAMKTRYSSGRFDTLSNFAQSLLDKFHSRYPSPHRWQNGQVTWQEVSKYISDMRNGYRFTFYKIFDFEKGTELQNIFRDSLMADNAVWLSNFYTGKKMIIIAHNEHVKSAFDSIYFPGRPVNMGGFLRKQLKDRYKRFGMLSAEGTGTGYSKTATPYVYQLQKPEPDTYEYYFSKASSDNYYLNFNTSSATVPSVFNVLRVRSVGFAGNNSKGSNSFSISRLADNYNGIFFIKKTTPTRSLHNPGSD